MVFFDSKATSAGSEIEFSVDMSGVREAISKLQQVPEKLTRKLLRGAMSKSLNQLSQDVKANAPVGKTGNLRKGIKKRVSFAKKNGGWIWGEVYGTARHTHLLEMGWNLYGHKKHGHQFLKRIEGRRFMRKAAQRNAQSIIESFRANVIEASTEAEESLNAGASGTND